MSCDGVASCSRSFPRRPLQPARDYEVSIGADAADSAGVTLEDRSPGLPHDLSGLAVETIDSGDGVDGIAPTAPIAVIFDRPIDPASVSGDQLTISPDVAGTSRSSPSRAIRPTTTARAASSASPRRADATQHDLRGRARDRPATMTGETMAEPLTWTFTTGPPTAAVSNGIAFVTIEAGWRTSGS
jgi:hypothetical protein